jgi:plastocyanin
MRIRNTGKTPHYLTIPSQQVDREIPTGGERVAVEITFPESGALRFFCKVHSAQGMNGQLLVDDAEPQPLASLGLVSGG